MLAVEVDQKSIDFFKENLEFRCAFENYMIVTGQSDKFCTGNMRGNAVSFGNRDAAVAFAMKHQRWNGDLPGKVRYVYMGVHVKYPHGIFRSGANALQFIETFRLGWRGPD